MDRLRCAAAVIIPAANAEGMSEHLKEISTQVMSGAHAALICDGAGWHQIGTKLQVPDNITLVHLPPYAPELITAPEWTVMHRSGIKNICRAQPTNWSSMATGWSSRCRRQQVIRLACVRLRCRSLHARLVSNEAVGGHSRLNATSASASVST